MTETGGQGSDWTLSLSSDQAADFLRSLVEDDRFRVRLQEAPEEALAERGIAMPRGFLPGPVTPPRKEDLIWAFGRAFPDWPRPSFLRRILRILGPDPKPPPFGGGCLCWGLAHMAAARARLGPGR